jgi:hypothetical protein
MTPLTNHFRHDTIWFPIIFIIGVAIGCIVQAYANALAIKKRAEIDHEAMEQFEQEEMDQI